MAQRCPHCGAVELQQGLADREQCLVCGAYYDVNGLRGPGMTDEIKQNIDDNTQAPQANVVGNLADIQRLGAQVAEQGTATPEDAVVVPPETRTEGEQNDQPDPAIDPETGGDPEAVPNE